MSSRSVLPISLLFLVTMTLLDSHHQEYRYRPCSDFGSECRAIMQYCPSILGKYRIHRVESVTFIDSSLDLRVVLAPLSLCASRAYVPLRKVARQCRSHRDTRFLSVFAHFFDMRPSCFNSLTQPSLTLLVLSVDGADWQMSWMNRVNRHDLLRSSYPLTYALIATSRASPQQ